LFVSDKEHHVKKITKRIKDLKIITIEDIKQNYLRSYGELYHSCSHSMA